MLFHFHSAVFTILAIMDSPNYKPLFYALVKCFSTELQLVIPDRATGLHRMKRLWSIGHIQNGVTRPTKMQTHLWYPKQNNSFTTSPTALSELLFIPNPSHILTPTLTCPKTSNMVQLFNRQLECMNTLCANTSCKRLLHMQAGAKQVL